MAAKRAIVEPDHRKLSIRRQCELIKLPRASYCRSQASESDENLALMRMMGLASVAPAKKTSVPARGYRVYPYLLRNPDINRPDHFWASDITYIKHGHVFLTAVMDWHSRYVLSWEISVTTDEDFCISALQRALRRYGIPEIFNTDQDSQFTGHAFTGVLNDHKIRINIDGRGRAMDNIMIERLWRTVKYDDIYLRQYESLEELLAGLRIFFDYYNNERPHSSLDDRTPAEAYFGTSVPDEAAFLSLTEQLRNKNEEPVYTLL